MITLICSMALTGCLMATRTGTSRSGRVITTPRTSGAPRGPPQGFFLGGVAADIFYTDVRPNIDGFIGAFQSDAANMSGWLSSYHGMVNANIERSKVGCAMLSATDGGLWNCKNSSMVERMVQLKADNVSEVSIFGLNVNEPWNNDGTSFQCPGQCRSTGGALHYGGRPTRGRSFIFMPTCAQY